MDRNDMLCAVAYLMSRESDAIAYQWPPAPVEDMDYARHLFDESQRVADDAGANCNKRWQRAVAWVCGEEGKQ